MRVREKALRIGHRGCGMNCVGETRTCDYQIPGQTEVENSLHGFSEARERGLSTVEFDLQLSRDHEVVVFHDYEISSELAGDVSVETPDGGKWAIASKTLEELR